MSQASNASFPVDETTLIMLRASCVCDEESGRSHLHDFLEMGSVVASVEDLGESVEMVAYREGLAPWHPNEVIVALVDEVERLRALVPVGE